MTRFRRKRTFRTNGTASPPISARKRVIGGAPSFVELLTCIELDQQAAAARRESAKPLRFRQLHPLHALDDDTTPLIPAARPSA